MPKVEFIDKLEKQAEYLCFLAKAIQKGEFQNLGFLVLPYPVPRNRLSVYFPDLPHSSCFWRLISKCQSEDLGKPFPQDCLKEVASYLKSSELGEQRLDKDRQIMAAWRQKEEGFFALTEKFLASNRITSRLSAIEFLLTDFGTCGSFYPLKENGELKIVATFRRDFPVSEIGRTLLLAFYRLQTKRRAIVGPSWQQRKAAVDYLVEKTIFSQLFPKHRVAKGNLDAQIAPKLVAESQAFLSRLGFPPTTKIKPAFLSDLPLQERKVLELLLGNRGSLVSYDQIAQMIWGNQAEEKFSLWSMAKLIQNLRRKLQERGIYKNLIITARKQGYLLAP